MMLSFVCAHTGGGQKGSRLSKQGHDYEPRSGAVWREDLRAIPCQSLSGEIPTDGLAGTGPGGSRVS